MPEQTKIVYPTLDLFLYDPREGLGRDSQDIDENRQQFWQRIFHNLHEETASEESPDKPLLSQLAEAEKNDSRSVELLGADRVKHFERPLDGYYYPLQIGDTYALQVGCSGVYVDGIRQPNYKPQPVENLEKIQEDILAHINHQSGKMGQTWMMWGQLCDADQNPTQLALECYEQLAPDPNWERDFQAKGQVLGAMVFELWHPPSDWSDSEKFEENYHLLIWLFPHDQPIRAITDRIAGIYLDLIHLLCDRNKVLWAYSQSRQLAAALQADSRAVQDAIRDVSELPEQPTSETSQMNRLREILTDSLAILSRYAKNLGNLETQGREINRSLIRYKKQLSKIEQGSNLRFWSEFSELAKAQYLYQIETDRAHFSFGLTVLENLIRTVEGITETYQAQRDRTLNHTIAIASVGLATSAVAASALSSPPPEGRTPLTFQATTVGISLLAGAIASLIIWLILRLVRR
jgi:hypothetical protein